MNESFPLAHRVPRQLLDIFALVLYCGWIYYLSAQESLPMPQVFDFQDKLLHFGAYAVMGVLALRALRHFTRSRTLLAWFAVLFCSLYGISDEWHQSHVPGRDANLLDWLADSLGALTAVGLMTKLIGTDNAR